MSDEELNELIRRRDRGDPDALEEIDAWIADRLRAPAWPTGAGPEIEPDRDGCGLRLPVRRRGRIFATAAFALPMMPGFGRWAS